jgi:transposase InsO family protein
VETPGRCPSQHHRPEPDLDHRLQGPVPHPQWDLLLPADHHRSLQPLLARLSRAAGCRRGRVYPHLRHLFRTCGLPDAIRSDNGAPFASTGIHGLNRLNVWWLQLGITHQRSTPGSPQENGAHERLHKTLKARATRPPAANLNTQQRAFNLHSGQHFLSQALNDQYIGLEEVQDGLWNIVYYETLLGRFDEPTHTITGAPSLKGKC